MAKNIKTPTDKKTIACLICDFLDKWLHLDKLIDLLCEDVSYEYDYDDSEGVLIYGEYYT